MAGATLCKSINRAIATSIAGTLGVGIHWIAGQCGQKYEPLVLGASVFIFGEFICHTINSNKLLYTLEIEKKKEFCAPIVGKLAMDHQGWRPHFSIRWSRSSGPWLMPIPKLIIDSSVWPLGLGPSPLSWLNP